MKNQTRIACILWAVTTIVCGCKKNEQSVTLSTGVKNSLNAGHPVYDLLGYGYDVTGRFADSESSRMQVLNIEKLVSVEPASLPVNNDVSTDYDYYFGESASTYAKGLSQKYIATVGFKVFGGEIQSSFKDSTTVSSKNVYAGASMFIKQKRWKLYSTIENIRNNYLSSNFLSDVASLSPAALVQRYGTHVLKDITLGAKFNVNYKSQTSNSDKMSAAKVGLKFHGLAKVVGFDGTYQTNTTNTQSNFNERLYYRSYGGDGTKGLVGDVKLDNSPLTLTIGNWQSSCNASNAVLIKIDENGLIALDELISNPTKSAQVKAYIKQYLIDKQVKELGEVPVHTYYSKSLNVWRYEMNPDPIAYLHDGSWDYKGIDFYAFKEQVPGSVPIYEFYAPTTRDCVWDQSNLANSYWQNSGVKFYAYPNAQPNRQPIYRYDHHKSRRSHFLGTDPGKPWPQNEWNNEGVVFYVPL